jgi:uridine kinase
MSFQIVKPRPEVEIHLPDGRVLSGPRGSTVGDFLATIEHDSQLVAAVVSGDLRELTYPIEMDSRVKPVTMSSPDGTRIYRRSLTFLMEMVFADMFPRATLFIDHAVASGGYYCQVKGRDQLSESELGLLKVLMQKIVKDDLPFERREVPVSEAMQYFLSRGEEDKVQLLKYRRKNYLTLYSLKERMDYHHGYMVPSTGYLRWFDLIPTLGGFTLLYPSRKKPDDLLPMPEYPKLLATFLQYGGWLETLGIENVGTLNDALEAGRGAEIVLVSEAFHEQRLSQIAEQVAKKINRAHLILVSGPRRLARPRSQRS